ncbi:MAG: helix-turn-helix domain-containing protein [Pseudomonadota bacterium]
MPDTYLSAEYAARDCGLFNKCQAAVLLSLATRRNPETGRCDPSQDRIAFDTRYTEKSVREALEGLTALGAITADRRNGKRSASFYTLNIDMLVRASKIMDRAHDMNHRRKLAGEINTQLEARSKASPGKVLSFDEACEVVENVGRNVTRPEDITGLSPEATTGLDDRVRKLEPVRPVIHAPESGSHYRQREREDKKKERHAEHEVWCVIRRHKGDAATDNAKQLIRLHPIETAQAWRGHEGVATIELTGRTPGRAAYYARSLNDAELFLDDGRRIRFVDKGAHVTTDAPNVVPMKRGVA